MIRVCILKSWVQYQVWFIYCIEQLYREQKLETTGVEERV
jgi:hypothetical protein